MKLKFQSNYFPIPDAITLKVDKPPSTYKLKKYPIGSTIMSIRHEFEMLHREQYTHIANMPGRLDEILINCRYFSIICLDYRMNKFVAEFCSKKIRDDLIVFE